MKASPEEKKFYKLTQELRMRLWSQSLVFSCFQLENVRIQLRIIDIRPFCSPIVELNERGTCSQA